MGDRKVIGWELVIATITFTALSFYIFSAFRVMYELANMSAKAAFTLADPYVLRLCFNLSVIFIVSIIQIKAAIDISSNMNFSKCDLDPETALLIGETGALIPVLTAVAVVMILQRCAMLAVITVAVLLFAVVLFCGLLRKVKRRCGDGEAI